MPVHHAQSAQPIPLREFETIEMERGAWRAS